MKAIRRLLLPTFTLFIVVIAVVGFTFAWVTMQAPPFLPGYEPEGDYYRFAELSGDVNVDYFEYAPGSISSNETYNQVIKISNTSSNAGAYIRARVSLAWEETDGTQVAIPKDLVDIKLIEGEDAGIIDNDWEWTASETGDGSWVRESLNSEDHILPSSSEAFVTLSLTTGELADYQIEDLNLKVSFVVEFEGELSWNLSS